MRILIDINHPAHVHFFRHAIAELKKKNHTVIITATNKEISFDLLKEYQIPFIDIGKMGKTLLAKILNLLKTEFRLFFIFLKYRPDIAMGIASARICHVALFFKTKTYIFNDTDHASYSNALFKPFATKIFTPSCYLHELGNKQVRYNGYHELAYLHPYRFSPDPSVLKEINVATDEKFFIVRFISWGAAHDIGHKGFSEAGKLRVIHLLEEYGRVFITSEASLPSSFDRYRITISPIKIHHLLYYAELYVGEGGTMATEASILGTPSLFVSTLTAGVFQELEQKYELQFTCKNENQAITKISELLTQPKLKQEWAFRRKKMLGQKIDVTNFIVNTVTNTSNK